MIPFSKAFPHEMKVAIFMLKRKYNSMISRCYHKHNKAYKQYGHQGIEVCNKWLTNIDAFIVWSLDNNWNIDKVIHRKNIHQGYSPDNCEYVTKEMHIIIHAHIRAIMKGETFRIVKGG